MAIHGLLILQQVVTDTVPLGSQLLSQRQKEFNQKMAWMEQVLGKKRGA